MNPYQPGEDNQDPYEVGYKAGAASRDVEVAELQKAIDENWVTHQQIVAASKERDQLRAELVNALAACKAKDEAILQENCSLALSFQPDDSALEAIVKKAGEVMRENCTKETDAMRSMYRNQATGAYDGTYDFKQIAAEEIIEEIRALPAVTLEDLK